MNIQTRMAAIWHLLIGKDLAALHPEVLERQHLAAFTADSAAQAGGYSYLAALGDYERSAWVRKAIKVIADNIAPLPLFILRDEKEVARHPLTQLFSNMNSAQASAEIWQQWTIDMLLGGEEGWELTRNGGKQYAEVWARQPHTITVLPDRATRRYYGVAGYSISDGLGDAYQLPPDEMIFFKFYNPRNPYRGLAPITAIRNAVVIDQFAQAWSRLLFQKQARPDYAVIAPEGLTPTERDDLEVKLTTKFSGSDGWFKPIILEQGVTDIKPLDFKPRDIGWVEQRELAREEIGAIFGVPDEIMGWGRDTYENFETAHNVLWTLTILPLCGFRDITLTEFFRRVGTLKENERVATDTSQVAALKSDQKEKTALWETLVRNGVPPALASEHVGLGLPRYAGDDVGYLPSNVLPAGTATMTPRAFTSARVLAVSSSASGQSIRRKASVEYGSAAHRALWQAFIKRTDPHARRLGEAVAALIEKQKRAVLAQLHARRKDATDAAANPFDLTRWIEEFIEQVKPILSAAVSASGAAALADAGIGIAFDVLEPAVLEFLQARAQRFAEQVNETTWTQLKDALTEGLQNGESIPDLAARVESVMAERIRSSGEVIARTEIIGASNGGQILAWKQNADLLEGKEWLATLDDRVREEHEAAHGQVVPLNAAFEVGGELLEYPGDDAGSAGNVINCRCTMIAHLKE